MRSCRKLLILLATILWLVPNPSYSGFISKDRTTSYQIDFELNWVQKFFNLFLKFEFLSWKETTLQELFIKDSGDSKIEGGSELIMISLTPKNFNEAMFLKNTGNTEGFIRFIKYEKLSVEGVKNLLEMINYFYDPEEGRKEFANIALLEVNPDKNLMTWAITKQKSKDQYLIDIQITLSNSKNPSPKSVASITAILNPLEKVFEQVEIQIKNGPKIKLTKKPVS